MVQRVSQFTISPGSLESALDKTFERLDQLHFADALWSRNVEMWTTDPETHRKIENRLGWLDAIDFVTPQVARIRACADAVRAEGFTDVVLLGMGGSSLAPEVLRQVIGVAPGYPRFRMLDSVDPDAVRAAMEQAETTLFVLASKSGVTIEPNAMAAEARLRVQVAGHQTWGSRFIAITDEGTALHVLAQAEQFRDIFVNPSNIGGRYSALSLFGLVPAALMGIDLDAFLRDAAEMAESCRASDVRSNPGLALGAVMAAGAEAGRDKLALLLPPHLASFGLWVEQLVAESTGKEGKGVAPIAGEGTDAPIGDDRIAVIVGLAGETPDASLRERLRESGAPIVDIEVPDVLALGAEFFRWEVATAAAGRLLEINPFDEPNVSQAKEATRVLLDTYTSQHHLPIPEPHAAVGGVRFTLSDAALEQLTGAPATRFLDLVAAHDYIALLAYLPPDVASLGEILTEARARLGKRGRVATMVGYGPRYLHSTGQLHKGGPNNGVFIVVAAPAAVDLPIPGETYSFGVLEQAQALGDFQSLDCTGRRVLLIQLPSRDPAVLRAAFDTLLA